jgi:alkylhydroperoxidase family enzyme
VARIPLPDGEGTERQRLWALRQEFAVAAQGLADVVYNKSRLPLRLRELVRMRIAQINDCPI